MLAAFGSDVYDIVLVLHILCAIVGFGAVMLNGIYAAQARARGGSEGLAITEANVLVSRIGQYFIYAVFVLGVVLVLIGDPVTEFDQTWIWLSIVLFIVGVGVSHGLLYPRVNRLIALQRELLASPPSTSGPPPHVTEMEQVGSKLGVISMALHLNLITILTLMVFKPGF